VRRDSIFYQLFQQNPTALMALTTIDEASTPKVARSMLEQSRKQESPEAIRAIIEMITTILVYKFTNLSRQEAEAMLGITTLQETRFYQEAKQDGERTLMLRLLTRQVEDLPEAVLTKIDDLSIEQVEALAEALLDFRAIADLETWLEQLQPN
jgi:predicted transposase YdaD